MEITILSENEQPLLSRKEVMVRVFFEGATPAKALLADKVSEKLGVKRNLVVLHSIKTVFGDTTAVLKARVYSDEAKLKELEREILLKKHEKPVSETPDDEASEQTEENNEEKDSTDSSTDSNADSTDESGDSSDNEVDSGKTVE